MGCHINAFVALIFAACGEQSPQQVETPQAEALTFEEDAGRAISAAFDRLRRSIPKPSAGRGRWPRPRNLNRFLGFLEGRVDATIPTWWTEALLDARASKTESGFLLFGFSKPDRVGPPTGSPVLASERDIAATFEKSAILVTIGDKECRIPFETNFRPMLVSTVATDEYAFVSAQDSRSFPYKVYCIQRAAATVVWSQAVDPDTFPNKEGRGFHEVELVLRQGHLFIFGIADDVAYIVKLDGSNGRELYLFTTSSLVPEQSEEPSLLKSPVSGNGE